MVKNLNCPKAVRCVFVSLSLFLLVGCVNDDYDLSNIDATIGVGSDTLSLPGNNNTQGITLDDVFDLQYTNFVDLDEEGYYFVKADDNSTHNMSTSIAKIRSTDNSTYTSEFTFTREDLAFGAMQAKNRARKDISAHFTGTIGVYDLTMHNIPASIIDLDYVETTATIKTTVSFSKNFRNGVNNIASVKLFFPQFMDVEKVVAAGEEVEVADDNTAMIYNVSPKNSTSIAITVKGLDFTKPTSDSDILEYVRGEYIHVLGEVTATGTVNQSDVDLSKLHASDVYTLTGKAVIGTVIINSAKGHFAPDVEFDRLGRAYIGELPLFLDDENVVLDLDNVKADLDISSNIPLPLLVNGALVGTSDGEEVCRVTVPQFCIPAEKNGVISFRNKMQQAGTDTLVVVVPQLADLLKKLPHTISFIDLEVMGDSSQLCEMELGHTYKLGADFSMWAPLAFGPEAHIVYQHPYTHWNHVLKDISFVTDEKGTPKGYCVATTDVENKMPFYITMSAYGLDLNGDSISTQRLKVEAVNLIPASVDGVTPTKIEQKLIFTAADNAVFKELDGIMLKISGTASDADGANPVVGKRLNYKSHTLTLKNLKVQIVGQLALDLN